METQVTTYYLELRSVEEFTASVTEVPDLEIREARIACPELERFLCAVVGRAWRWTDRLSWPYSGSGLHTLQRGNHPQGCPARTTG